jgi:hypothetical protein
MAGVSPREAVIDGAGMIGPVTLKRFVTLNEVAWMMRNSGSGFHATLSKDARGMQQPPLSKEEEQLRVAFLLCSGLHYRETLWLKPDMFLSLPSYTISLSWRSDYSL